MDWSPVSHSVLVKPSKWVGKYETQHHGKFLKQEST